jgi:gamma-glutamylcyclotransferase (GGCT)/AIG2-like uncharacterized protein YtfP
MEYIFVYDKLREYSRFTDFEGVETILGIEAKAKGKLFIYQNRACMVPNDKGIVKGNLIISTDTEKLIRKLDIFMEHSENDHIISKTMRGKIDVDVDGTIVKAWCYVYPQSMEYEFEKKGIELEDGDYLKYLVLKEKEKNV